jgi:hypothetical protein
MAYARGQSIYMWLPVLLMDIQLRSTNLKVLSGAANIGQKG